MISKALKFFGGGSEIKDHGASGQNFTFFLGGNIGHGQGLAWLGNGEGGVCGHRRDVERVSIRPRSRQEQTQYKQQWNKP